MVARKASGRHQPSGIPPQHLDEFHLTRQRPIIFPNVAHGAGKKARSGGVARSVIGLQQIVIDSLGNADRLERVSGGGRDPCRRSHRPVAARIKQVADLVRAAHPEDLLDAGIAHIQARRSEDRGRHGRDGVKRFFTLREEVEELFLYHAFQPKSGPIEPGDLRMKPGLFHQAHQAGVDYRRRAAAMYQKPSHA